MTCYIWVQSDYSTPWRRIYPSPAVNELNFINVTVLFLQTPMTVPLLRACMELVQTK